jgi:outer membrane protein assembly factor BamB
MVWNFTTDGEIASSPAVAEGVLYVGSGDDSIYALNAATGALIWHFKTNGDVASSPAIADNILYVGSYDGNLYALNATTGSYLWSYTTSDMVVSSPAVANGIVYVGSYDHVIYAFGSLRGGEDNVKPFPWAMVLVSLTIVVLAVVLLSIAFYRRKTHKDEFKTKICLAQSRCATFPLDPFAPKGNLKLESGHFRWLD